MGKSIFAGGNIFTKGGIYRAWTLEILIVNFPNLNVVIVREKGIVLKNIQKEVFLLSSYVVINILPLTLSNSGRSITLPMGTLSTIFVNNVWLNVGLYCVLHNASL